MQFPVACPRQSLKASPMAVPPHLGGARGCNQEKNDILGLTTKNYHCNSTVEVLLLLSTQPNPQWKPGIALGQLSRFPRFLDSWKAPKWEKLTGHQNTSQQKLLLLSYMSSKGHRHCARSVMDRGEKGMAKDSMCKSESFSEFGIGNEADHTTLP